MQVAPSLPSPSWGGSTREARRGGGLYLLYPPPPPPLPTGGRGANERYSRLGSELSRRALRLSSERPAVEAIVDEFAPIPLDAETKVSERPDDHKTELRLWLRLFTCKMLVETEVRRRLREKFDLTLPRFDLMAQLDRTPQGMTLGELSRRMMVSNGNVTGLVDRLEAQGLIRRRPAPKDRRSQFVSLTAEGRKAFRAIARANGDWIAEIFSELSQDDMEKL